MSKAKKWKEKLNAKSDLPKIVVLDEFGMKKWGGKTMVVPHPKDVEEIMASVTFGKLITVNEIRIKLAEKYKADIACPLTTGIFTRIVAETVEEDKNAGIDNKIAWWRTLKSKGILNEKYPGGMQNQINILQNEGFSVRAKGKNIIVEDYEKFIK